MKNFPVKVDGKEYWISRSIAVCVFVFKIKGNKLYASYMVLENPIPFAFILINIMIFAKIILFSAKTFVYLQSEL